MALWLIGSLLALLLLSLLAFVIYYNVAVHIATPRNVRQPSISRLAITSTSDGTRLGNNWLRHGQDGLWELYIEGDPMEREWRLAGCAVDCSIIRVGVYEAD